MIVLSSQFLTSGVASTVATILTPDTMEQVSTWADQVKTDPYWAWSEVRFSVAVLHQILVRLSCFVMRLAVVASHYSLFGYCV